MQLALTVASEHAQGHHRVSQVTFFWNLRQAKSINIAIRQAKHRPACHQGEKTLNWKHCYFVFDLKVDNLHEEKYSFAKYYHGKTLPGGKPTLLNPKRDSLLSRTCCIHLPFQGMQQLTVDDIWMYIPWYLGLWERLIFWHIVILGSQRSAHLWIWKRAVKKAARMCAFTCAYSHLYGNWYGTVFCVCCGARWDQ